MVKTIWAFLPMPQLSQRLYLAQLREKMTQHAQLSEYDFIVDAKTVAQAEAFATTADLVVAAIND